VKRATALFAVAALFFVGVLVGVLGTHLFYLHEIRQPGGLARLGSRWLARSLDRRLDLTAEQRKQVDAIIADTAREAAALRRQMTPRMLEILERSRRRISALLTPEQRERFERFRRAHGAGVRKLIGGP
jgi:Spy/CpxP family protein refolding chaperone